jgi:dihydrodipicolinate synthase/N-acetylneuraminate lyase
MSNGFHRTLRPGVWAPIPTFLDEQEEIGEPRLACQLTVDFVTFKKHVVSLAKAGMAPVVCGSMGEAHHLVPEERIALFRAAREALDEAGLKETVLIVGT